MTPTESTDRPASDLGQPMPTCKKCNKSVYVNEKGFAGRKPYVAGLCVDHIWENFKDAGLVSDADDYIFPSPPGSTEQELHNAKRLKIRGWWAGLAIIVTLGVVLACIIAVVWNALKMPYPMIGG